MLNVCDIAARFSLLCSGFSLPVKQSFQYWQRLNVDEMDEFGAQSLR